MLLSGESVRLLLKLLKKLAFLALTMAAMGYAVKYGWRFAMQASGVPQVSSEESDLMSTVFGSAVKLVTGSAKKEQLASELSDKLYAGRGDSKEMAELGIELVKPSGSPAEAQNGTAPSVAGAPANKGTPAVPPAGAKPSLDNLKKKVPVTLLGKLWDRLGEDRVGLALVPAAFVGMFAVRKFRRRPTKMEEFMPLVAAMQNSGDSDPYDMQHGVLSLGSEDFELLVALIYQRQGYRVTMPAGQSGGRGGDFTLARKAEQLLVQCKKLACEHKIAVERVREFHEAMVTANFTRGLYVASCGFSWDARHFAKTKGITLINARTLDQLLTAAREDPEEDLLAVARWAPKLLQKVTLTPALCPTCDAAMDEIVANGQTVWVCSQRPDCRGRRSARKHRKPAPGSAPVATAATPKPTTPRKLPPAIVSEVKSAAETPAQVEPAASKKKIFQRIVSKSAASNSTVPETALPSQPEECECRPANLKSVVPRKRLAPASDPAPAGTGRRADSPTIPRPAAAVAGQKVPGVSSGRPTAASTRPGTRA